MADIKSLLNDGKLPEELVISLQEAFDKKVEEVREQAEMSVREEFARRYEHDKEVLVEAVDRMLTDALQKQETEKTAAVTKFVEARQAFRKALRESKLVYRRKLNESNTQARNAVTKKLKLEVQKLRTAKRKLTTERLNYADKFNAVKESLLKDHKKRVSKIDEFIVRHVTKELKEFQQDKQALIATRLKLVTESKAKLKEAQRRFVKEAAVKVERTINAALKSEMAQLHEDLERSRQNMFGRRIFESVAAEFMTSYLSEGTEIAKLNKQIAARENELKNAIAGRDQALRESQIATRKARQAEDRAVRTKTMGELLHNLRGEKRTVMEGMLETVRTEALRESFNKLLPVVLDDTNRNRAVAAKKPLIETRTDRPQRMVTGVTGEQRANRLAEAAEAESMDIDPEIAQVIRLAGIRK
jgi:hypothetical protein